GNGSFDISWTKVSGKDQDAVEIKIEAERSRGGHTEVSGSVSAAGYRLSAVGPGGSLIATDLDLLADGLNLDALISAYRGSGTATLSMLADFSGNAELSASELEAETDGASAVIGNLDFRADSGRIALDFDNASVRAAAEGESVSIDMDRSDVIAVSGIPFTELAGYLGGGMSFDKNVYASLHVETEGLEISSADSILSFERFSSGSLIEADLALDGSPRGTRISTGLSAPGFLAEASMPSAKVSLKDPEIYLDRADAAGILDYYREKGAVSVLSLIDLCGGVSAEASHAVFESESGSAEADDLYVASTGRGGLDVSAGYLSANIIAGEKTVEILAEKASASLSSGMPLAELAESLKSGRPVRDGSYADASLEAYKMKLSYADGERSVSASFVPAGGSFASIDLRAERTPGGDLLAGGNVSAQGYAMDIAASGDKNAAVTVSDLTLAFDRADADLLLEGALSGDVSVAALADACGMTELDAGNVTTVSGDSEFRAENLHAEASGGGRGYLELSFDKAGASLQTGNGTVDLDASRSVITASSGIPFSELAEAIRSGLKFEKDAYASVHLESEGIRIDGAGDAGISFTRITEAGPGSLKVDIILDASGSGTRASIDLSAAGYAAYVRMPAAEVSAKDPVIVLDRIDVVKLAEEYRETGSISVLSFADYCGGSEAGASKITVLAADGVRIAAEDLRMKSGGGGRDSLDLTFVSMDASFPAEEDIIRLEAGKSSLSVSSSISFSELAEAIRSGLEFEKDAYASASLESEGLAVTGSGDTGVTFTRITGAGPGNLKADIILDASGSGTRISIDLDAPGFEADISMPSARIFMRDPAVTLDRADADKLADEYQKTGSISVLSLADECAGMELSAGEMTADAADGTKARAEDLRIKTSGGGKGSLDISFGKADAGFVTDDGTVRVSAGETSMSVSSSMPFFEFAESLRNDLDFAPYSHAAVRIVSDCFESEYASGGKTVLLSV
ncbi:MAG: hypothetical protein J5494_01335, partial [Candidatus Methanomethylophilaceae archaeon]|nr:hypothetical protein [Candidatus Methanomethylophilaceae archaeon]